MVVTDDRDNDMTLAHQIMNKIRTNKRREYSIRELSICSGMPCIRMAF